MSEAKSKPTYGSVEELGSEGIRRRLSMAKDKRSELEAKKVELALAEVLGDGGAAEELAGIRLKLRTIDEGEEALHIALAAAEVAEERAATLARADEIDAHRAAASTDAAAVTTLAALAEEHLAALFQAIDDLRAQEASLRRHLSAGKVDAGSWSNIGNHVHARLSARTKGLSAVFAQMRHSGDHAAVVLGRFHDLPSIREEVA